MQVKTFTGASSQEVLAQIKAEMGPDAVILSNRTYRKDGEFRHEIMAGLDRPVQAQQPQAAQAAPQTASPAPGAGGWSEWHKDWQRIKDQLYALMKPAMRLDRLTPRQRVALEYLQREGVSDDVALELYNMLASRPGASVLESLASIVPVRSWGRKEWPQRLHMFAGPFGSGKTATALRFALHLRQENPDIRITFVNADCLRANGRLLLRHWAELSDFGYLEAPDAEGMRRALSLAGEADAVFVDMPGLPQEGTLEQWTQEMEMDMRAAATHLTLCPFYDPVQMRAMLRRYAAGGGATGVVWTKLDESVSYGSVISVARDSGLPVSAISYGPELKESLSPATEPLLWRLIFKRQLPIRTA